MLPRTLVSAAIAGLLASFCGRAEAGGAWIGGGTFAPVEQRVAVAVGPARTTLWTSLRFSSAAGPVAIVVPAPPGASLDFSSDAWFEALELATAPRIFPPLNASPYCPGKSGPATVFELDGQTAHVASLMPADVAVLDDVPSLSQWLTAAGLTLPAPLAGALSAMAGVRFVSVRYQAPGGDSLTPTLRVAMPGAPPRLPLAITRAGTDDLKVTAWAVGAGRATLTGGAEVVLPPTILTWSANDKRSNYEDQRQSALAADPQSYMVESTSYESLAQDVSIASGKAMIAGVVGTYFVDAAKYGDGSFDSATCIAQAGAALASHSVVSASCPRAALGVVDSAPPCAEVPTMSEVDPDHLRCGTGADDLAVALSGLVPASSWLTRTSLEIPAGASGADWTLDFGQGPSLTPVLRATSVDVSECSGLDGGTDGGTQTGSSSSSSSSGGSSGKPGVHGFQTYGGITVGVDNGGGSGDWVDVADDINNTDINCGCSNNYSADYSVPDTSSTDTSCSSGSDTGADSCSGDGSSSADSCSGDGSSSADSCSGDGSGADSCSSTGGGSESCGGGGGDVSCSGGGGLGDCSVSARGLPRPKMSALMLSLLAIVAPLRRRGRRRRG